MCYWRELVTQLATRLLEGSGDGIALFPGAEPFSRDTSCAACVSDEEDYEAPEVLRPHIDPQH